MKQNKKHSQDWTDDCLKYWGRVLEGKQSHWCPEWDDLPIDETCWEFGAGCICFGQDPNNPENLQDEEYKNVQF